jgi:hypothetical protein
LCVSKENSRGPYFRNSSGSCEFRNARHCIVRGVSILLKSVRYLAQTLARLHDRAMIVALGLETTGSESNRAESSTTMGTQKFSKQSFLTKNYVMM